MKNEYSVPKKELIESGEYGEIEGCLEGTYFYDIDRSAGQTEIDFLEEIAKMGLKPIKPLRFGVKGWDTVNINEFGHMALCEDQEGRKYKVRNCFSLSEANRMQTVVNFATAKKVSTPGIVGRKGQVLVLDYIEGDNPSESLEELDLLAVAKAHFSMEIPFETLEGRVREKLNDLINYSINFINEIDSDKARYLKNKLDELFPDKIIPVFDHQDNGVHNLLKGVDDKFWWIDEEAFGILPFGYTLERALYGNGGHGICVSEAQRETYVSVFTDEQIEYYNNTREFWKLLLVTRSVARALFNKDLVRAIKLLSEI